MSDERPILDQAERELRIAPEWLSLPAYAIKYGISRHTVYKWLDRGLLEEYRVGWLRRIRDRPPKKIA